MPESTSSIASNVAAVVVAMPAWNADSFVPGQAGITGNNAAAMRAFAVS